MKDIRLKASAALLCLGFASAVHAQQSQPNATAPDPVAIRSGGAVPNTGAVPSVVRFSGSFHPSSGSSAALAPEAGHGPAPLVESVTLSVYRDQDGGTALWQETQNVAVDGEGKYSVLMGATQNDGVPLDLLSAGEPRWLGVQFNRPGEAEQPRVLMASVPYALKSVDAETLGGKPASAYLLASSGTGVAGSSVSSSTEVAAHGAAPLSNAATVVKPRTISGQQGYIPVFTDGSNDLGDSVMQQSNGYIGVGTFPGAGANTTPSLDLRTYPFSQIGMAQTTDYLTFFASDTYGPAIYWDPTKDLRLGKGGNQLYGAFGFVEQMRIQSATGNVGIGTMSPGSTLDVNGNVNFSGSLLYQGSPVLQVGGQGPGGNVAVGVTALQGNTGYGNTAAGTSALQNNTIGFTNTAMGTQALQSNTTGSDNTATGVGALGDNTTGTNNVANGFVALERNTTGSRNVAVGYDALPGNTTGTNNIAIGYEAANAVSGSGTLNIHIGSLGLAGDNGTIRIGTPGIQTSFFVGGVSGVNLGSDANAVPVVIDTTTGQLGVGNSSAGGPITGVTAGTDLTGGGTNGVVTLNLDTSKIPTLAGTNTFAGPNTFTGTLNASLNINFGGSILSQGSPVLQFPGGIYNSNIALGDGALQSNTTGTANTASGRYALSANTGGSSNTATGYSALSFNTSGYENTATGYNALYSNTTGYDNTATGFEALLHNTTGSSNIAVGLLAAANVSGGNSNNIHIGSQGAAGDSGVIRIGGNTALGDPVAQTSFFVAGVANVNLGSDPNAVGVLIDTMTGQLGVASSSRRYKEDIEDMGDASRDLMRLRPITFRYKKAFADGSKPIQYGLIAEEVDEVYPDLVAHSADGQIETVKYQVLDSMLLNEVQKQNQHAQQQDETIRKQQEQVLQQQGQIRSLEARLAALEGLLSGKGSDAGTARR